MQLTCSFYGKIYNVPEICINPFNGNEFLKFTVMCKREKVPKDYPEKTQDFWRVIHFGNKVKFFKKDPSKLEGQYVAGSGKIIVDYWKSKKTGEVIQTNTIYADQLIVHYCKQSKAIETLGDYDKWVEDLQNEPD